MELLQNPIFIGGILPALFFGIMDFLFRVFVGKTPFQNVFFYTATGGLLTMIFLSFTLFTIPLADFWRLFQVETIVIGIVLGIIWTISISSMGIAYEKFQANASQVVPIASSSGLLSAFIGVLYLNEQIDIKTLTISSILIILGIFILTNLASSNKTKNKLHSKTVLWGVILGGIVPLLGFGILNVLFKMYSSLSGSILGIIMTITAIIISLCIQGFRKQKFVYKPILMTSGIFWALAVGFLGYGFYPLMGDASTLLPILAMSPLCSLLLVRIFIKEKVTWSFIILGTISIVIGIGLLNI